MTPANAGSFGQRLDRQIAGQMTCNPDRKAGHPIGRTGKTCWQLDERLAVAWRPQFHHQLPRDGQRGLGAKVFLNEVNRHVNSGSATGRAVEAIVFEKNGRSIDSQLWEEACQVGTKPPMSRD